MALTCGASCEMGRSAHWPVKRVTFRGMEEEEPEILQLNEGVDRAEAAAKLFKSG